MSQGQLRDDTREWLSAVLYRSLLRFPELESFDNEELGKLVIFWDNIVVRWLQRLYRGVGVEVVHEPENRTTPITFFALPEHFVLGGQRVMPPPPLGIVTLTPEEVNTYGREGIVERFLEKRLSGLFVPGN